MIRDPSKKAVAQLRDQLAADPENLDLAKQYWEALGKWGGSDIRSAADVVAAFGRAALISYAGAIQLAKAYLELFELSGEAPRRVYIDDELRSALAKAQSSTFGLDADTLRWVLDCLDADNAV